MVSPRPPEFRPIPGIPGYYVSLDGVVITSNGRVLPQSRNSGGMMRVVLPTSTYARTSRNVTRLVFDVFSDMFPDVDIGLPRRRHARRLDGRWVRNERADR